MLLHKCHSAACAVKLGLWCRCVGSRCLWQCGVGPDGYCVYAVSFRIIKKIKKESICKNICCCLGSMLAYFKNQFLAVWCFHCYHCLPWTSRQELRFFVTSCWAIAHFQDEDLHSSPLSSRCAGMTRPNTPQPNSKKW